MISLLKIDQPFVKQVLIILENHLEEENYGVAELARELGMSRSNLLKKIKKLTDLSASQFIRQVRLEHSLKLLRKTDLTVSEVSYRVGFSSSSYFIKCFRELYGYPPGKVSMENNEFNPARSHRLVAIVFTDIEGYTALMQQDEESALRFIDKHRKVFNRLTEEYRGNILQYYGDGTLSTFDSVIDAVRCCIAMQKEFRAEPIIPVRIGIHSGDIIFTKDGVIGDGVNVASRIESLSIPNGILVSEKIYDEVKNQKDITTESLGEFEFKNVGKAIEVFAIANEGLTIPKRDEITGKLRVPSSEAFQESNTLKNRWIWLLPILLLAISIMYAVNRLQPQRDRSAFKMMDMPSIAALPFINDSNDTSNVYFINGLRDAILDNLQKINNLAVISRSATDQYRGSSVPVSQIAKDLQVDYLIEGSGQKINDRVILNIQLVAADQDVRLSSKRYDLVLEDAFRLQSQVAMDIVEEMKIVLTPEEEDRIAEENPVNPVAYDHFLKGQELINQGTRDGLIESLGHFRKAIEIDPGYALPYAYSAMAFYYLDILKIEKTHKDSINLYADKALMNDPDLPQALLAKGLYYMGSESFQEALPFFERAHQLQPGSSFIVNLLSDYFISYKPDSDRYLEYAIKGIKLAPGGQDSVQLSFNYLHVSNALIQSGFIDESEMFINQSLVYDPDNLFAQYLRAYIIFARNRNLKVTKQLILDVLNKDSTRLDVIQEVAKVCFYLRDFKEAEKYYSKFLELKEENNMVLYPGESGKIALTFAKVGKTAEAKKYIEEYHSYAMNPNDPFHHLSMAAYESYHSNVDQALFHFQKYAERNDYSFWMIEFLELDPLFDSIKGKPEFQKSLSRMESKFWQRHENIKKRLKEEGVL